MATYITESGNGSTDVTKWKVVYSNGNIKISYFVKKDENATLDDLYEITIGNMIDMREIVCSGLFDAVPNEYTSMIGDSLAALQRVLNAASIMYK